MNPLLHVLLMLMLMLLVLVLLLLLPLLQRGWLLCVTLHGCII